MGYSADRILEVDVLSSGVIQGSGPLTNIISATVTEELDRAGEITLVVPATDAQAQALLVNDYEIRIRTTTGASYGGIIDTLEKVVSDGQPLYRVIGTDRLGELNRLTTGYSARYDAAATGAAIIGATGTAYSLLADTGWTQGTVTVGADYTNWTIQFEAATRLAALIQLGAEIGHHFREGSTARTLDFSVMGASSGYRISNLYRNSATLATDFGVVGDVSVSTISADIENRLFPLGANKFDLRDAPATLTDILVQTERGLSGFATTADGNSSGATIPVTATTDGTLSLRVGDEVWVGDADDWTQDHEDGIIASISAGVSITLTSDLVNSYAAGADVIQRPQFYIEDATSQSSYGVREACPQFPWIGFSDTSADDSVQAALSTTLYRAAKARLTRYKDTYTAYLVPQVYNLPTDLRVGQKVYLDYVGVTGASGTAYLTVAADLYVMSISRTWSGDGTGGARGFSTLTLASVDRPTPINLNLVLYDLDTSRWTGLG